MTALAIAWPALLRRLLPVWLAWLVCSGFAQAAPLQLEHSNGHPSLQGRLSLFIDATGKMNLEQVIALRQAGRFSAEEGKGFALGIQPDVAIWVHFSVRRNASAPSGWWLNVLQDSLDHIEVHVERADGRYEVRHGGRALPFAQRELPWRGHAFQLNLDGTGERNVYIRIVSGANLRIWPSLWQSPDFERFRAKQNFIWGLFFGAMGIGFLVVGSLALRHRSPMDICYALYILGLQSTDLVTSGYLQQFGFSDDVEFRQWIVQGGLLLAAVALTGFVRTLIAWPKALARRMNFIVGASLSVYLLILMTGTLIAPRYFMAWNAIGILIVLMASLLAGIWGAWKGFANARAYVLAFLPFTLVVTPFLLEISGAFHGPEELRGRELFDFAPLAARM